MRVLLIIDTWFPAVGGGQINAWEITKRLAKKGINFEIVTRNNGKEFLPKLSRINIHKIGRYSKPDDLAAQIKFLFISFLFSLNKDFDLIHVHPFWPAITAKMLSLVKQKPIILTVHGTRLFEKRKFFTPSLLLEKLILTVAPYSAQISVTKAFTRFNNFNKKVIYISNGINSLPFLNDTKRAGRKILWVGRFDKIKNLPMLIEAFGIVLGKLPDAELHLVGYGYEEKKIKQMVKKKRIINVFFEGYKDHKQLKDLYKKSDVFVLPSQSEGLPITALEAAAAGLPIVVTKIGGAAEILKSGGNGLLVRPNSPPDIARAIIEILQNPQKFKNLNTAIAKHFNWDLSAKKTLLLYKSLINEK